MGSDKNLGRHAANRVDVSSCSRPSSTVATQCAPRGDQRMRWRLAVRALAISATEPSARKLEIGRPAR